MKVESEQFTQAQQVLEKAELIYTAEQITRALDELAEQINQTLENVSEPVIAMPVMNGGLILCGHLITRFRFPVQLDYLHATRYRQQTTGSELHWKVRPQLSLQGKTLLIIDDILDEGYTLQAIKEYCLAQGAQQVICVVLIEKKHDRTVEGIECDFIGLHVEDRYVFGFGMDYKGYHRGLNGIYAVGEK